MRNVLEEKLKVYSESHFDNKEFLTWLRESNLWMMAYSCLRIRGIEMDKKQLVDMFGGRIIDDIPLDLYTFLQRFKDLYKEMQASFGMQESMNPKLLIRFAKLLLGQEGFRRDNSIVFNWGYIPPHFNEIEPLLTNLFKKIARLDNPIDKARQIHLGILQIYPFGDDSKLMAAVAMYYELMNANIPLPSITADSEDYERIISKYFKLKEDVFSEMLYMSLLNRIDSVIMYGEQSKEK